MRVLFLFATIVFFCKNAVAQELFPRNESASTIPKNTLGVRLIDDTYKESHNRYRQLYGIRIMYGLLSKLSIYATPTISNHHSNDLPPAFPDHNTPQVGVLLPFRFNGVDFYAKYRVYANDGEKRHFRIAAYAEWSLLNVPHDEAEPTLLDDTKGFSVGLITTYLKNRFAISFNGGIILPGSYNGIVPDEIPGLPSLPARVEYGRAISYNVSFGYFLLPKHYDNYKQTNWNIYFEFVGKAYEAAKIFFDNLGQPGTLYPVSGAGRPALAAGNYIEAHPGIQCILRSNLRIDFSVGIPVYHKSYVRFYPQYEIGIQRYFYFNKKKQLQ